MCVIKVVIKMTNNAERRTNMSSKITIIGAGSVGATIAYTLSQRSIASEIVLIDINKDKAEGEVMDIEQGTSFREPISIVAGDYPDAADSDIVIITSGIARKPGQTRIELTQTNVNIMKSITPEIVKVAPKALYIIVSNPCDVMTYAFAKLSGLPENQILGSGTALDTARLRCRLSQHYGVSEKNIHAYVFGEHGDTSFVPWSRAFVAVAPSIPKSDTLISLILLGRRVESLSEASINITFPLLSAAVLMQASHIIRVLPTPLIPVMYSTIIMSPLNYLQNQLL